MGRVIKYFIYILPFDRDERAVTPIVLDNRPTTINSYTYDFGKAGTYKVWISAVTYEGEGPRSNHLIVSTEDQGKSFIRRENRRGSNVCDNNCI